MELLNFSQKNKSAEHLARLIFGGLINIDDFLDMLDEDPDWLEDNIRGEISQTTLLKIIETSYNNQQYRTFLTYIIDIIDGTDINGLVFVRIFHYPNTEIKEGLLISLAHKKLKENQLRCLCTEEIAFECYFELVILYYTEKSYTKKKLEEFIEEFRNCKYSYMYRELLSELAENHVASNKTKYEYITSLRGNTGNGKGK